MLQASQHPLKPPVSSFHGQLHQASAHCNQLTSAAFLFTARASHAMETCPAGSQATMHPLAHSEWLSPAPNHHAAVQDHLTQHPEHIVSQLLLVMRVCPAGQAAPSKKCRLLL
mmetsp:Transcript_26264/g.66875  ORF Transcript_26264/g.66875 Transcript_26264/m.66875 type:complete len:113 (-) Transcript_26264:253-591(-)